MDISKNRLMIILSLGAVIFTGVVFTLHRFNIMNSMSTESVSSHSISIVSLLVLIALAILTIIFYKVDKDHPMVPLLVTLTLTFSSIGTVIGGEGMVEYHFSIFMVVAILSYYENVKLIFLMTGIFAVEHITGYIDPFFTKIIFGVPHYTFSMLLIHVVYLLVTSGATTWQILNKKKYTNRLEKENEDKQLTIEEIINKLSDTGQSVLQTVKNLKGNSDHFQHEIHQITAAIQQMAAGADTQLRMSYDSGKLLGDMTKGINQMALSASVAVEAFSQTSEKADYGKVTVQKSIEQIDTIFKSFGSLTEIINNLEKRSVKINDIIQVISDISVQTNLLALNAAIEAARAGEFGKGFSVVADEVRKLAVNSNDSVEKVAKLINEIQQDTSDAIDAMKIGTEEVNNGIVLINQTEEVFERILRETKNAYEQIIKTSTISEKLSTGSEQVVVAVQNMTEVAKETASSSESIAKSSEKQLESITDINQIAGYLKGLVDELNNLTSALHKEPSGQQKYL